MSGPPGPASRLWPVAIIGVLAVTVVANLAILRVASGPGASALEPDAYARAVAWDSTAAVRAASATLGWTASATISAAARGGARVRVVLVDRAGRPIDGAIVRVEAIHNREMRRVRGTLPAAASAEGAYEEALPLVRRGMWELRLDASRGNERFVASLRAELDPAPASPGAKARAVGR